MILKNGFHGTAARVSVRFIGDIPIINDAQWRRAQQALCGREGCQCEARAVAMDEPVLVLNKKGDVVAHIHVAGKE